MLSVIFRAQKHKEAIRYAVHAVHEANSHPRLIIYADVSVNLLLPILTKISFPALELHISEYISPLIRFSVMDELKPRM